MTQNMDHKINHWKCALKNKQLEKTISDFLIKLSHHKGLKVSIMLNGNIEGFIDGKILKSNSDKIHFYFVEFHAPVDHNVSFHQFK